MEKHNTPNDQVLLFIRTNRLRSFFCSFDFLLFSPSSFSLYFVILIYYNNYVFFSNFIAYRKCSLLISFINSNWNYVNRLFTHTTHQHT